LLRLFPMKINGHHLHIETHGDETAPPVILLHHGLGTTRAWRRQVPALVEAGYRVIVYDRWGYGQSDPRPRLEVPSFADDLADLEQIIAALELPPAALIGHSDGGTIALYHAARYPQGAAALLTVAAHIYIEPKMETGIQGIRRAFESDERFRTGFQRVHGDKYESVFRNWYDGWHTPNALDWDMRPLLGDISCPALVIQGEEDEHAVPQHARDIATGLPDSELWLVPGAQHMLPQENADVFNERVIAFLKRALG